MVKVKDEDTMVEPLVVTTTTTQLSPSTAPMNGSSTNTTLIPNGYYSLNAVQNSVRSYQKHVSNRYHQHHHHHNGHVIGPAPLQHFHHHIHHWQTSTNAANAATTPPLVAEQPAIFQFGPGFETQSLHQQRLSRFSNEQQTNGGSNGAGNGGNGASTQTAIVNGSSSIPEHIVHFHVNPGISVILRFGNSTQLFHGPVTVPMVSTNSTPPVAMPVQVPPGHFVQQIVDENGTLRHVILSPTHLLPIPHNPPHFNGPVNGTTPPPPPPQSYYASNIGGATYPTTHYIPGAQLQTIPPTNHSNGSGSSSCDLSPTPPTLAPTNTYARTFYKSRKKTAAIEDHVNNNKGDSSSSSHNNTNSHDGNHTNTNTNTNTTSSCNSSANNDNNSSTTSSSHVLSRRELINGLKRVIAKEKELNSNSMSMSEDGAESSSYQNSQDNSGHNEDEGDENDNENENENEDEDDNHVIAEVLSSVRSPEVSELSSRSALLHWFVPEKLSEVAIIESLDFEICESDLRYEILLSDKGQEGKYKSIYNGESLSCCIQDLKPNQEYSVCLKVHLDEFQGSASDPLVFVTPACEPDRPQSPKATGRSINSLQLRWNPVNDNGSPLLHYILEYSEASSTVFVEVLKTKSRHCSLSKLAPLTYYRFRLAAVNDMGKSAYSDVIAYRTAGTAPTKPNPPTLIEATVSSLHLIWECRATDEAFTLQADQIHSSHGFVNIFQGPANEFICRELKRYTEYKFRLRAYNDEGSSAWSDSITFKTLACRPLEPSKPTLSGKPNPLHLRLKWDNPIDNGGAPITTYILEVNSGKGFEPIYTGPKTEAVCETLQPGTTYQCRVSCITAAGRSNYSETTTLTTDVILPSAPLTLRLSAKPKTSSFTVKWSEPEIIGGLPIVTYELELESQDSSRVVCYRGKETEFTIKGLQPGHTYQVLVRVGNRIGFGPWSSPLTVTTAASVPNAPNKPDLTAKSSSQIYVEWREPTNNGAPVTKYQLEMSNGASDNDDDGSTFASMYQGPARFCDVKGLLPYTCYSFRVAAVNSVGRGQFSTVNTIKTKASVPATPNLSHNYRSTSSSITFHWNEPISHGSDILYYNIELADQQEVRRIEANQPLEYTIDSLSPLTSYRVRVQAVNELGPGPFTNYFKFSTLPLPPSAPELECTAIGHSYLKLKWSLTSTPSTTLATNTLSATPSNRKLTLVQYFLEMFNSQTDSFQCIYQVIQNKGNSTSFKMNKLQENSCYKFRINAKNDAGLGEYSNIVEYKTSLAPPIAIKSLNCTDITSFSCSLDWSQPKSNYFDDPIIFQLLISTTKSQQFKQIYRGPETCYKLEDLEARTEYCAKVCPVRIVKACNDIEINGTYCMIKFETLSPGMIGTGDQLDSTNNPNAAATYYCGLNYNSFSNGCTSNNHNLATIGVRSLAMLPTTAASMLFYGSPSRAVCSWTAIVNTLRSVKALLSDNYHSLMFVFLFMFVSFLFAFLIEIYINWR